MHIYLFIFLTLLSIHSGNVLANAKYSVTLGFSQSNITFDSGAAAVDIVELETEYTPLLGANITKTLNDEWSFGLGMQYEKLLDFNYFTLKAIESTYDFNQHVALGGYIGGSRLSEGVPAYGYRFGLNLAWTKLYQNLDWVVETSLGDTIARDKHLASDPPSDHRPDLMYDVVFFSSYLRWTF